jgi:hypothetical protein
VHQVQDQTKVNDEKCRKVVKNETFLPLNSLMDFLDLPLSYYSNFTFEDIGIGAAESKRTKNLHVSPIFFFLPFVRTLRVTKAKCRMLE